MPGVAAIVLAAGSSERMGRPKLLLPYRGSTVLGSTLAAVSGSSADRVVVVTGAHADAVEEAIVEAAVTVVRNPDPRRGTMSSLLAGVGAVPDVDSFVKVPGDLPTVSGAAIDALVELWRHRSPWAAVTAYRDRIADPFLVSRAAIGELAHLTGSKVLWRRLVVSGDERVAVAPFDADAPLDVNTPVDYEALLDGVDDGDR